MQRAASETQEICKAVERVKSVGHTENRLRHVLSRCVMMVLLYNSLILPYILITVIFLVAAIMTPDYNLFSLHRKGRFVASTFVNLHELNSYD